MGAERLLGHRVRTGLLGTLGGKLKPPTRLYQIGVGEALLSGLRRIGVELPDLRPAAWLAELLIGDLPQRVAFLHVIDRLLGLCGGAGGLAERMQWGHGDRRWVCRRIARLGNEDGQSRGGHQVGGQAMHATEPRQLRGEVSAAEFGDHLADHRVGELCPKAPEEVSQYSDDQRAVIGGREDVSDLFEARQSVGEGRADELVEQEREAEHRHQQNGVRDEGAQDTEHHRRSGPSTPPIRSASALAVMDTEGRPTRWSSQVGLVTVTVTRTEAGPEMATLP